MMFLDSRSSLFQRVTPIYADFTIDRVFNVLDRELVSTCEQMPAGRPGRVGPEELLGALKI